jgi:hypothetical protein
MRCRSARVIERRACWAGLWLRMWSRWRWQLLQREPFVRQPQSRQRVVRGTASLCFQWDRGTPSVCLQWLEPPEHLHRFRLVLHRLERHAERDDRVVRLLERWLVEPPAAPIVAGDVFAMCCRSSSLSGSVQAAAGRPPGRAGRWRAPVMGIPGAISTSATGAVATSCPPPSAPVCEACGRTTSATASSRS